MVGFATLRLEDDPLEDPDEDPPAISLRLFRSMSSRLARFRGGALEDRADFCSIPVLASMLEKYHVKHMRMIILHTCTGSNLYEKFIAISQYYEE